MDLADLLKKYSAQRPDLIVEDVPGGVALGSATARRPALEADLVELELRRRGAAVKGRLVQPRGWALLVERSIDDDSLLNIISDVKSKIY